MIHKLAWIILHYTLLESKWVKMSALSIVFSYVLWFEDLKSLQTIMCVAIACSPPHTPHIPKQLIAHETFNIESGIVTIQVRIKQI